MILFALLWVANADAAIYKWKDENGKTHFTDDPTKVPEKFCKKPFIKGSTSLKETPKPQGKRAPVEEGDETDDEGVAEEPGETEKKDEEFSAEQVSAIKAVISFLEGDIPRYEAVLSWEGTRRKFGALKQKVGAAIPQKQALLAQVGNYELPELKSFAGFLQASIAADEKTIKMVTPSSDNVFKRMQPVISRLKGEAETEKQLLQQLTTALDTKK